MSKIIKPKAKVINLLKGNSNEKRLERKVVGLLSDKRKNRGNTSTLTDSSHLETISKEINKNISDNDMLFQILPDLKLAMSFLISSILSPKDLQSCKLHYSLENITIKKETITNITSAIEKYFTETYNLNTLLPTILEDVLFLTGSYTLLILPETEIDRIINTDCVISKESLGQITESLERGLGFLSTEKNNSSILTITDNFNILKRPRLNEKLMNLKVSEILNNETIATEATKNNFYKRRYDHVPISILEANDNRLLGEPIIIKCPSESTIPIHLPGDCEKHIGYFILLDSNGYPINGEHDRKVYEQLQGRLSSESEDNVRELIKQTNMAFRGYEEPKDRFNTFNIDVFTTLVETELKEKLSKGLYKEELELSNIEIVSKIMLARTFKQKRTTVLFVPEKLVSYIAFKYNKVGVGKSLLEDTRILSSLRSVLMLSNVMASMKNSVPRTGVKINLDEDDPDPRATVEFLLNEFSRNYNQSFPIGLINPADIVDAIQRSSIDVAVSGNTRYPQTDIDVTDKTRSVAKPDSDLENQLRRRQYMSFGLPPEVIDADMNIEYAVSVIMSNAMAVKEISVYQEKLSGKASDFVRKYISASEKLTNELFDKIGKKKAAPRREKEYAEILNALVVSLPTPDTTKLENQLTALDTYSSGIDKAIEFYFSENIVGRLIEPDLEEAIEPTKECIKAYFVRQWMQKNNIFSELMNLTDISDPENKMQLESIQKDHIDALLETVGKLMLQLKKKSEEIADDVSSKLGEEEEKEGEEETEEPGTPEEEGGAAEEEEEETGEGEETEEGGGEETEGGGEAPGEEEGEPPEEGEEPEEVPPVP